MNTAIATKLNVLESAIVRIEEWTHVLFVVVKGLGGRFVSKKVIKEEKKVDRISAEKTSFGLKLTIDSNPLRTEWVYRSCYDTGVIDLINKNGKLDRADVRKGFGKAIKDLTNDECDIIAKMIADLCEEDAKATKDSASKNLTTLKKVWSASAGLDLESEMYAKTGRYYG